MNCRDTEALTIKVVTDYYKKDMTAFYKVLHPKTIMLSVGEGQLVDGKEEIVEKFREGAAADITYELSDISCLSRHFGSTSCYTVMDCRIMTLFPDGVQELVNERVTVLWKYIKKSSMEKEGVTAEGWYSMHIHSSVAQPLKKDPDNYAHVSETVLAQRMAVQKEERVMIRDINSCVYYIPRSQIVYFETANYHVHAHCLNGKELIFRKKMALLEQEMGERFIRINRKHLVNVNYVIKVSNYKLYLMDDTVFSIPYEKYREIKSRINQLILEQNIPSIE